MRLQDFHSTKHYVAVWGLFECYLWKLPELVKIIAKLQHRCWNYNNGVGKSRGCEQNAQSAKVMLWQCLRDHSSSSSSSPASYLCLTSSFGCSVSGRRVFLKIRSESLVVSLFTGSRRSSGLRMCLSVMSSILGYRAERLRAEARPPFLAALDRFLELLDLRLELRFAVLRELLLDLRVPTLDL